MIRLETPRLILRELTPDDLDTLFAIYGDSKTMVWYPRAYTRAEVEERITNRIANYPSGFGLLGVAIRESGELIGSELIGDCGLSRQEVEGVMEPEIGYHIRRSSWNRGLATEAARAVRDYAFDSLGLDHVISMIRPENVASRRVAEKNGLTMDRVVFWRGYDHCVYRLEKTGRR